MRKMYLVIKKNANPYDMNKWKNVMLTMEQAEGLRRGGFIVMELNSAEMNFIYGG